MFDMINAVWNVCQCIVSLTNNANMCFTLIVMQILQNKTQNIIFCKMIFSKNRGKYIGFLPIFHIFLGFLGKFPAKKFFFLTCYVTCFFGENMCVCVSFHLRMTHKCICRCFFSEIIQNKKKYNIFWKNIFLNFRGIMVGKFR